MVFLRAIDKTDRITELLYEYLYKIIIKKTGVKLRYSIIFMGCLKPMF